MAVKQVRFEDKTYENVSFSSRKIGIVEYEQCKFKHCDFSGADLSNARFVGCEFSACDLSNVKSQKTSFRDVTFKGSKLLGVHFDQCHAFLLSMEFENCKVDFASFFKLNLHKTLFKNSTFHETDFSEADLTGSLFDRCDLSRALFGGSNLEKVDFRTSYNYAIDPDRSKLKKAKFSLDGLPGLLLKYDIEIE
jgi:fluoroquinolone resistance protein